MLFWRTKFSGLEEREGNHYKFITDPSEMFLIHLNPSKGDQILILYYFYIFRTTFHSQIQGYNGIKNIHRKRLARDSRIWLIVVALEWLFFFYFSNFHEHGSIIFMIKIKP